MYSQSSAALSPFGHLCTATYLNLSLLRLIRHLRPLLLKVPDLIELAVGLGAGEGGPHAGRIQVEQRGLAGVGDLIDDEAEAKSHGVGSCPCLEVGHVLGLELAVQRRHEADEQARDDDVAQTKDRERVRPRHVGGGGSEKELDRGLYLGRHGHHDVRPEHPENVVAEEAQEEQGSGLEGTQGDGRQAGHAQGPRQEIGDEELILHPYSGGPVRRRAGQANCQGHQAVQRQGGRVEVEPLRQGGRHVHLGLGEGFRQEAAQDGHPHVRDGDGPEEDDDDGVERPGIEAVLDEDVEEEDAGGRTQGSVHGALLADHLGLVDGLLPPPNVDRRAGQDPEVRHREVPFAPQEGQELDGEEGEVGDRVLPDPRGPPDLAGRDLLVPLHLEAAGALLLGLDRSTPPRIQQGGEERGQRVGPTTTSSSFDPSGGRLLGRCAQRRQRGAGGGRPRRPEPQRRRRRGEGGRDAAARRRQRRRRGGQGGEDQPPPRHGGVGEGGGGGGGSCEKTRKMRGRRGGGGVNES